MSSITGVKLLNNCSRSINSYIFTENGFYNCTGSYNIYIAGDSRNVTVSRCNLHDGDGAIDLEGENLSITRYCFCPMQPIVVSIPCNEWLLLSNAVNNCFCPIEWLVTFVPCNDILLFSIQWMAGFVPRYEWSSLSHVVNAFVSCSINGFPCSQWLFLYPTQRIAEGIMFLTRPSVS